jgi:thioredoxin reductase (NADPH)
MDYDYDVIVIGGGPAGLSAAIRARWIKRYKAVPCSTLVIENSFPGGLAGWHGCLLTGPAWEVPAGDIVGRLMQDINGLAIPVHQAMVKRIDASKDIKGVSTSDGRTFRSLAVILAAGIKVLTNERTYLGKGLDVTSMGYEFIVAQLKDLLSRLWEPRLVITGSPGLLNMIPLIRQLNTAGSPLLFVIEGSGEDSGDIVYGHIEKYLGRNRVEAVRLKNHTGTRDIACGRVLLDFNSYELTPVRRMQLEGGLQEALFIDVDQDMKTAVPGMFAAGDVTAGGYNSLSRALAQGIAAGLSAYSYVFQRKFGFEPPLFAYRPTDFTLPAGFRELPLLHGSLKPKALADMDDIRKALETGWEGLLDSLDGSRTIGEIAREKGIAEDRLQDMLQKLVEKKLITVHAGGDI